VAFAARSIVAHLTPVLSAPGRRRRKWRPVQAIKLNAARRPFLLAACALLAGCGTTSHAPLVDRSQHEPGFISAQYEPFNRQDVVAIALREWRLFGQPLEDDARPHGTPRDKPERDPGLWQRVGEYWWIGQNQRAPEAQWTGKHDAHGQVFPPGDDGSFAWSAAFVSYVMRVGGAGDRFPYAPDHATYVNAAAAGRSPVLRARAPEDYPPQPGDIVCLGRGSARTLKFADLPTPDLWPGHCAIVVRKSASFIDVIGGNVSDAVELAHVPVTEDGMLAAADGTIMDPHHAWFVVLQVLYDAEAEPDSDR
jgi:hypothetical protein